MFIINSSQKLIEGIKQKFAGEVHETSILNKAEEKIISYFTDIYERTKDEFDAAKSLDFDCDSSYKNFLRIRVGDTGLSFIKHVDYIEVKELLKSNGERHYDKIYIENKALITELYPKESFTMAILNKYLDHLFEDYMI